jgi:hypothetical protein
MFEDLEKIEWGKLTHAYGAADDVPGLLRSLTSRDQETRSNSIHELCSNIWHQGTVYEASAHAVPFLLQLLESPEIVVKEDLLAGTMQ